MCGGMLISIDCTEVEYKVVHTIKKRAAKDDLTYNASLEFADLLSTRNMIIMIQ